MKKAFNKIKTSIAAFWITIISFFSKVFWQNFGIGERLYWTPQLEYWVPSPISPAIIVSKIAQRSLIWITFIVWIVNIVKIREIDDKVQKKKKVKKTIVVISILIILIVACIITTLLLKR